MYQKQKVIENLSILIVDLIGLLFANVIAYVLRYQQSAVNYLDADAVWTLCGLCVLYSMISVLFNTNKHFFRRGHFDELISVLKNVAVLLITFIVFLYLTHQSATFSRLVFGYFALLATMLIYLNRLLLKVGMLRYFKHSKFSNRLLLVTTSDRVREIIAHLYDQNDWNRILIGVVLIDQKASGKIADVCGELADQNAAAAMRLLGQDAASEGKAAGSKEIFRENLIGQNTENDSRQIEGYPVVAGREGLIDYVTRNNIDEVFFSVANLKRDAYLKNAVDVCEVMGLEVYVNIETFDILQGCHKGLSRIGKYAVVTFSRNVFSMRQQILKRLLDVAGSLVGMAFLGIAAVIVGPLIKLESKGPILFGQTRVGKNGRKFTCYKFRSMYMDAEERKKELMKQNEMNGLMFKMENDPRITKVGKLIRKTSIDELPQFWNILRGDMSLVGTRPPTVDEYERYSAEHKSRLSMKPGLTGLWQISGRSQIKDFDEVVKLDMEYIDNWNIMKDIKIILKTIGIVFTGRGAE